MSHNRGQLFCSKMWDDDDDPPPSYEQWLRSLAAGLGQATGRTTGDRSSTGNDDVENRGQQNQFNCQLCGLWLIIAIGICIICYVIFLIGLNEAEVNNKCA